MNAIQHLQGLAARRALFRAIGALTIAIAPSPARADRLDDFKKLEADFEAAREEFVETHRKENPIDADFIRNYEDWPVWQYLPRYIALAKAKPADDTAYQCCLWVFDCSFSSDHAFFATDQKAWQIIAAHHATGDNVPTLCLKAARNVGPAREAFLRGLLEQPNPSKQHAGFATLALAELLAQKFERAEYWQQGRKPPTYEILASYLQDRIDPEFIKYVSDTNIDATKKESAKLFRVVLDRDADVNEISASGAVKTTTLGDRAKIRLHALEHLYVGAEAPDIVGQDLNGQPLSLRDYRGRVVLLSFWFTGCGPCMELIPDERKLADNFKDRPFALLGVSRDPDIEMSRKTVAEQNISWPCWFDGQARAIHRHYNIMGWPTLYLLDQDGRIVQKDVNPRHLEEAVAELLDKTEDRKESDSAALGK